MRSKIILAHDNTTKHQALLLARQVQGEVFGHKFNDMLYDEAGAPEILSLFGPYGATFADVKLLDIPNTVANTVKRLALAGASIITVHASGGLIMVAAAVRSYEEHKRPHSKGIAAVTVLTSLSDDDCREIYGDTRMPTVLRFAKVAADAGAWAIVCSARELVELKKQPWSKGLYFIVPGTRSAGVAANDQANVDTPQNAVANGADYLVIGREATASSDPLTACQRINEVTT